MFNLTSLLNRVKGGLDKWRLLFLAFALAYAVLLLFELAAPAIQWDEITHLNGGSFLLRGEFQTYISLSAFYPPMFDSITMIFFKVLGVSVFSGRLVAVVFSLLTLGLVFEFARRLYNAKTALLASALLAVMPGYVWLSRMAMIETMLVFFFTLAVFCFYLWLKNHQNLMLVFAGVALGLGFLTKYQMIIAGVIMVASLLLLARDRFKFRLSKLTILILTVILVAVPWLIIAYQTYASNMLSEWFYALQVGNPEKSLYSTRFDAQFGFPVSYTFFYFIEMVYPYSDVHPISLLLYVVSILGLGLLAWRRKMEDKYLLIWFAVVLVFFTLIPNKQWRYVLPLFPVLAIACASLIFSSFGRARKTLSGQVSVNRKRAVKVAAALFTAFLIFGAFVSVSDAYYWVAKDDIQIQIGQATSYSAARLGTNQSIMIVCPFNLFSQDMVRFYLWADGSKRGNPVYQYPALPVDTYTPNFNITEFVALCRQNNVKMVMLYEHGTYVPYFNTTLNLLQVATNITDSGKFSPIMNETMFGENPRRIIVIEFLG
jgi:4-amino-4-deoxy-L-arabinose transferase-like glycosyltransferase